MISGVLGEIDDRWSEIFKASGQSYSGPRIVLFRNVTNGGRCGMAQAAMGPFYCPPDKQIFLDTGFFREVETRFHGCQGSACKFTAAYIIAHEAGHHIQNLLGILPKVTAQQQQLRADQQGRRRRLAGQGGVAGRLPVRCLGQSRGEEASGLHRGGRYRRRVADRVAIGDDTLQRQTTGRVVPDSFTHGSAAQRKHWFMTGYQQGHCRPAYLWGGGAVLIGVIPGAGARDPKSSRRIDENLRTAVRGRPADHG